METSSGFHRSTLNLPLTHLIKQRGRGYTLRGAGGSVCLEQDVGAKQAGHLCCHLLSGDSLPSQGDRPRVHSWWEEQHHPRLRVLRVQPHPAHGDEVQGRQLLWRQPWADDGGGQNPCGQRREAGVHFQGQRHRRGVPLSHWCRCRVRNAFEVYLTSKLSRFVERWANRENTTVGKQGSPGDGTSIDRDEPFVIRWTWFIWCHFMKPTIVQCFEGYHATLMVGWWSRTRRRIIRPSYILSNQWRLLTFKWGVQSWIQFYLHILISFILITSQYFFYLLIFRHLSCYLDKLTIDLVFSLCNFLDIMKSLAFRFLVMLKLVILASEMTVRQIDFHLIIYIFIKQYFIYYATALYMQYSMNHLPFMLFTYFDREILFVHWKRKRRN